MAQPSTKIANQKITLSTSRDIPFNKLRLSAGNVRRIKAGVSIEQLADDIARRTLLQSITVRPLLDADGVATGMYAQHAQFGTSSRSKPAGHHA